MRLTCAAFRDPSDSDVLQYHVDDAATAAVTPFGLSVLPFDGTATFWVRSVEDLSAVSPFTVLQNNDWTLEAPLRRFLWTRST